MPKIARVVAVDLPHHVTQRGNRRQDVFFDESDYAAYVALIAGFCKKAGTEVWAYCLMPNHVHFIMVPHSPDGLRASLAEAHRRYSLGINRRFGWRGHLWQDRFSSFPMSQEHLIAAARYIELNPVSANIVSRPEDYRWSSARAHLSGEDDGLVRVKPLLDMVNDWKGLLDSGMPEEERESFRHHERTGRPMGSMPFVEEVGKITGRTLEKMKPGPKKNDN